MSSSFLQWYEAMRVSANGCGFVRSGGSVCCPIRHGAHNPMPLASSLCLRALESGRALLLAILPLSSVATTTVEADAQAKNINNSRRGKSSPWKQSDPHLCACWKTRNNDKVHSQDEWMVS